MTSAKPLVMLKNRNFHVRLCQKTSEKASKKKSWSKTLWTDETEINEYQSDGKRKVLRRKGTSHDLKQTTSSVKHGGCSVVAWTCIAAYGTMC